MEATDCERTTAERALAEADNHCKTAIVMILAGLTADEARHRLQSSNGFISQCTHRSANRTLARDGHHITRTGCQATPADTTDRLGSLWQK